MVKGQKDRISDLPDNVKDIILGYLPPQDAARTSVLSKKWERKWHSARDIIIDRTTIKSPDYEVPSVISSILCEHEGKVRKFSVTVNRLQDYYILKSWLCNLSKKRVQDLALNIIHDRTRKDEMPSDIFSCRELETLELCGFAVKSVRSFKGFPCLATLHLKKVQIAEDVLQSIISKCPALERLTLENLKPAQHLHIFAPKLSYFSIGGKFKSIVFKTPNLLRLWINSGLRVRSKRGGFQQKYRIIDFPPTVEVLDVHTFHGFLATGNDIVEDSMCYRHLRTLVLDICFEEVDQVSCLLSMIAKFSNLQILDIEASNSSKPKNDGVSSEPVVQFWEEQRQNPACSLNQLHTVRLRSFPGGHPGLRFIQFVLANSPLLQEMKVEHKPTPGYDKTQVTTELMRFRRASARAEIIYSCTDPDKEKEDDDNDHDDDVDDDYDSSDYSSYNSDDSY